MLWFAELVSNWRSFGKSQAVSQATDRGDTSDKIKYGIGFADALFEDAHLFCFDTHKPEKIAPNDEPLDLPFATCAFERVEKPMAIIQYDDTRCYLFSMIIRELSFNRYAFMILIAVKPTDNIWDFTHGPLRTRFVGPGCAEYENLKSLAHNKLDGINDPDNIVGREKCKERIKIGSGKNKTVRVIKNITHILPKKLSKGARSVTGREIDWSHRWEVRGHWRRLDPDKIGKDRSGNYIVQGYTWIKAFTKGPDGQPVVKKTRIVGGNNEGSEEI